LSKVGFLDCLKFFLVNYLLGVICALIMDLLHFLLTGEVYSTIESWIFVFGWCIIYMLLIIWKEIKEVEKQNG